MRLSVGQKVAYPNQGVCLVEEFKDRSMGDGSVSGYRLRLLGDSSTIFVPIENTGSVGLRPLISIRECHRLIDKLSENFEPLPGDWKARARSFAEMLRSGDIFKAADVLKTLVLLSHEKKLSFREQTLLEKSKHLILSEIVNTLRNGKPFAEDDVMQRVEAACLKHGYTEPKAFAAVH
ncbi:MAG: hypothetical protein KBD94_01010 [Pyrinomonadaceae bacterium]|nr:hypothetical protein [Pyrinomonadaceae bacterium]